MVNKIKNLRRLLKDMSSVLVAYSGGVDSTLLAFLATQELGSSSVCATAVSPSGAAVDLENAGGIAKQFGFHHVWLDSHELEDARYLENSPQRCYWCKQSIYQVLMEYAHQKGLAFVVDGNNADDLNDYRPGRQAAREHGVHSPLMEVGLTKTEIRSTARALGLPNWDTPSRACLSSRIPYGTPITVAVLRQIEAAEEIVREFGIRQVRVRHHGTIARIEIDETDFENLLTHRQEIAGALRQLGYTYITLDLAGYRTGSLNLPIPETQD